MDAFDAAYDAVLARWPLAAEPVDVPTAYGTTRVNVCGPADAPPLVLLSSFGSTSTVWFGNVAALGAVRRLYAVDFITDVGRSVAGGRRVTTMDDLVSWLDSVRDGLGLDRIDLCGHSFGARQALGYALRHPDRVGRLALLDPTSCFAGMRASYLWHALPMLLRPTADRVRAFYAWESGGVGLDEGWLTLVARGADRPRSAMVIARQPRDAELAAMTTPTLVLLADRSRAHDIGRVAANARRLLPDVVVADVPGSHHSVPIADPDEFNRRLVAFLGT